MSKYTDAWLSGFVGGEGCFALNVYRHTKTGYNTVVANFSVKLRRDDEKIIHLLKDRLDCGVIYYADAYLQTKPSIYYSAAKIADLQEKVIPFFSENPMLNKKHSDFEIFKKGIAFIYEGQKRNRVKTKKLRGHARWSENDWEYIKSIGKQLMENRNYNLRTANQIE